MLICLTLICIITTSTTFDSFIQIYNCTVSFYYQKGYSTTKLRQLNSLRLSCLSFNCERKILTIKVRIFWKQQHDGNPFGNMPAGMQILLVGVFRCQLEAELASGTHQNPRYTVEAQVLPPRIKAPVIVGFNLVQLFIACAIQDFFSIKRKDQMYGKCK